MIDVMDALQKNHQQQELGKVQEKLQTSTVKQQKLIIEILKIRFNDIPESTTDDIKSIDDLDQLDYLLSKAIAVSSLDEFLSP